MMYVVTLYLCKPSIKSVLDNIPKQLIQSRTPLVNKQFAPGFHSNIMTTGQLLLCNLRWYSLTYLL